MSTAEARTSEEIPPDNATRVAIFDAMHAARKDGRSALTAEELHELVLPRLRVLVPRELYLAGESAAYLEDKINVCLDAQLLVTTGEHRQLLALSDYAPRVRYPNDEIRDYTPGLEPARERLEADNAKLREAHFDVRDHVTSTAADPERFAALVQSMREHGYLKQFPIVELSDGGVLDGRARRAAAAAAGIKVERFKWSPRDKEIARRRDTPLTRVLLVLDQNASRLRPEDRATVHDVVARTTGRTWEAISADLELTQAWRGATSRGYRPTFACRILRYRPDGEPKIHVTKVDNKVAVGTLLRAAGLHGHKRDWLKPFVPLESGLSDLPGAGPSAFFAPADVLLEGIETMLRERHETKMKIDAEWTEITAWLRATFSLNGQIPAVAQAASTAPQLT